MSIEVYDNIDRIQRLEPEWDALLDHAECRDVLYSYRLYHHWIRCFAGPDPLRVTVLRKQGRLEAALPLSESDARYGGFSFKVLRSLTNEHSARFDFIARDPGDLGACLDGAFASSKCNVMQLDRVPERSAILRFLADPRANQGYRFILKPFDSNQLVHFGDSFDEYTKSISPHFRRNINAAERKSLSLGELRFSCVESEQDLLPCLERGYELEASGWKGQQSTAIQQDARTQSFYTGLARDFFAKGWLQLYLLSSPTDDLSFYYCVNRYGYVRALKVGVNSKFLKLSPGMLLTKRVLKQHFERKDATAWDFCGGSARWKRDWANGQEPLYSVMIFRKNLSGALLHGLGKIYLKTRGVNRSSGSTGRMSGSGCLNY